MLVGEQPGDQEDLAGEPFVGPAGQLLREALACRMWLTEEIATVKPRLIIALGATAAGTLLGSAAKVTRDRGKFFDSTLAPLVTLTVHPSSILRAPDSAARVLARSQFVADLKSITRKLNKAK